MTSESSTKILNKPWEFSQSMGFKVLNTPFYYIQIILESRNLKYFQIINIPFK